MYLDFISDIAKVGDSITIVTRQQTIEGEIIKISSELIAVKTTNGAVFFCKDEDILELNINNSHTKNTKTLESSMSNVINDDAENLKPSDTTEASSVVVSQDEKSKNFEQGFITTGTYDSKWDQIDKQSLLTNVKEICKSLTRDEKTIIIASNASVREVLRRTFRVTTEELPKLSVNLRTIIENALLQELLHFSIGDSLPVVIYYHQVSQFEVKGVFLTLLPNTIAGYLDLLKQAIEEGHYRQAKSLCYFLRSQSIGKNTLWRIGALIKAMKSVNAFIKDEKDNIKSATKTKIPRYYKDIEKHLNELIKKGEYSAAITKIDKILGNLSVDNKYKSSLLLRKAQTYSSITDYKNAQNAYISLIEFNESVGGESKNLSHLYTELARLQAMDKMELGHAQMSAEKALRHNPQNKYAATLLEQIKSGSLSSMPISNDSNSIYDNLEDDKELMLEIDDSALTISKMIDIDIKEHKYIHDLIISNGGIPSCSIAESLLQEAKSHEGTDLGEKYPIYLEAAKAFSELPVGSYDLSKYMESVAFYAVYKANFLFNQFNNNIKSLKPSNILYLKRLKDSACSYYIESLNLLPNTKINLLSMILCNYIKLNVALLNYENNHNVDLSGNLNKIFLSCINSSNTTVNEIVWKTIIEVGAASSNAWNSLWRYRPGFTNNQWRVEFKRVLKDPSRQNAIYEIINRQNHSTIDIVLSPGTFLKQALLFRQKRLSEYAEILSKIIKEDLNLHLLSPLMDLWESLGGYSDLFNNTETESKKQVDQILFILKPYTNRNQIERTNLLIQVQRLIEEQLTFINLHTTYYGRTFFFPLLSKWKRIVMNTLEKKIADTMPQLVVLADPPYIVDVDGTKIVNLLVKNVGESTAEGCVMTPNVIDLSTGNAIKGKNIYNNEIPSGNNLDVPMNLPPAMNDVDSIKLVMSISPIYQGKELEATEFEFTLEKEPESSLRYEDIPWNDGPIPVEQMFKGRKQILDMLTNHYMSIERDKPYILYGLTRTGKSSILKYLGNLLDKKQITISGEQYCIATFYWDLSQASSFGNNRDMWEYLLFDQFNEYLDRYIGVDGYNELSMPEHPRAKELNNALNYLHKKHIYPIFFVDEFSFIKVLMDNSVINPAFLHTLRQFSFEGKAGFIYAGTYDVDALLEDPKYGITGQLVGCKKEQISEIDKDSAEELIQVLGNRLVFTREAIDHIHRLSGDVPYFVQMICKYCGFYAVENRRSIIGYPELEHVIKILTGEISSSENSLVKTLPDNVFQNNMFSPADPKEVNVLITSIVHFNRENKEHPRGVSMVELQELWATKKVSAFTAKLADSIELLTKKKVLKDSLDEDLPVYTLNVDLFRRWWSIHHPDISVEIGTIS
jgi:hypothetical protein